MCIGKKQNFDPKNSQSDESNQRTENSKHTHEESAPGDLNRFKLNHSIFDSRETAGKWTRPEEVASKHLPNRAYQCLLSIA